jgi:hypothetical protein
MLYQKSVSFVLAAFIFIIFVNFNMVCGAQESGPTDPLSAIKEFHANFENHFVQPGPDLGQTWTQAKITYPSQSWSPRYDIYNSIPGQEMQSHNEEIIMNKSNSEKNVEVLNAINRVRNRDIIYDDSQMKKDGSGNSVDIRGGNQQSGGDIFGADDTFETSVDRVLESGFRKTYGQGTPYERLGNYMNIEVAGITVSAINTVPDGSAVANSNIIIKPVQIVVYPSEVEEKLK